MQRYLAISIFIICICCAVVTPAEARRRKTTTTTTSTTPEPTIVPEDIIDEEDNVSMDLDDATKYHPAEVLKPRVLDQMDRRYRDGNFEYKFTLSNGVSRYEKSYWIPVGKTKFLARKGYYSHPLDNSKYLTVFYTADENGYHENSSKYSNQAPVLPRTLEVPVHEFPQVLTSSTTSTTTRKPTKTTRRTRKPKTTRATRKPWTTTTTAKSV